MTSRRISFVLGGLVALSACGGSSGSSIASSPVASSTVTESSNSANNQGSVESATTAVPPVTVGVDPTNLLIDSSLDIAAIDGPVVLWFWAPG